MKFFNFQVVKFSVYLNRHVFVMLFLRDLNGKREGDVWGWWGTPSDTSDEAAYWTVILIELILYSS